MTTSRNTIWALGLILLVLATGQTVLGASTVGCEGASCDASCGTPPNGNTGCNAGCDVGCDAGSKPVNRAACANAWSPDDEPLFRIGRQCFQDLCETCDGCTWKADASVLVMHRSTPGTRAV